MGARPRKPVTTPANRERRVAVRVAVDTYIRASVVHEGTGSKAHGWVRNLSSGGMYLETGDTLPADAPVRVNLMARDGDALIRLAADAWVARVNDHGLGIQFDALPDDMPDRLATLIERFAAP